MCKWNLNTPSFRIDEGARAESKQALALPSEVEKEASLQRVAKGRDSNFEF